MLSLLTMLSADRGYHSLYTVNPAKIARQSSLIAYLYARLVSQSGSFMVTRRIGSVPGCIADKMRRHMLDIIVSTRITVKRKARSWKMIFGGRRRWSQPLATPPPKRRTASSLLSSAINFTPENV